VTVVTIFAHSGSLPDFSGSTIGMLAVGGRFWAHSAEHPKRKNNRLFGLFFWFLKFTVFIGRAYRFGYLRSSRLNFFRNLILTGECSDEHYFIAPQKSQNLTTTTSPI